MRSLTFVVVAVMWQLGTATAQDRPKRLSAADFLEVSFPIDVIKAAREADAIALRIVEIRREIELRLKKAERVYDDALFRPDISVDQLISAHQNYRTILLDYWSVDQNLKVADEVVESYYSAWTVNGVDELSAQVFQKWLQAACANYISANSSEIEASRLMLNIGIDRINRQLRRQKQKPGRYKAPKLRRIND